jgi:hypothetical protein
MIPFFRKLRKEDIGFKSIKIIVSGNVGIASNTIHMLDLFAFFTRESKITIDTSNLEKKIYSSKRSNFIEFAGKLIAQTSRGDILKIIDRRANNIDLTISIENDEKIIQINQTKESYFVNMKNNPENPIKQPFHMPYQSDLTAKQAEQILDTGDSYLTSLEESYLLHKPMLAAFNLHLSSILNKQVTVCPIT